MLANPKLFVNLLKITCACLFAGRAWQHLFFNIPLTELLWDQQLMEGMVGLAGMPWQTWASSPSVENSMTVFTITLGLFYLLCLVVAARARKGSKWLAVLPVASVLLFLLSALSWKGKGYQFPQLFEHTAQFGSPLLLFWAVKGTFGQSRLLLFAKIAIAITFTCHGLYALGFPYPRPGHFVDMTIGILGIGEPAAHSFLFVAGIMDLLISIGLFVPALAGPSLLYAVAWGLLTSLARIVANFDPWLPLPALHQWWFQTVLRMPHALLPLLVYMASGYKLPFFHSRKKEKAIAGNQ